MIRHVLFDNDGTIVDSEILAVNSTLKILSHHGIYLDEPTFCKRFPGMMEKDVLEILEKEHRFSANLDYLHKVKKEYRKQFEENLEVIPGMDTLFRNLKTPKSMVSNGSVEHVRTCLNLVNLLHDFQGKIFSSEQVDKPKPHPDVYLHAIGNLDLKPNQIVVVEDSPTGVQAAKYAGLRVIGFLGAAHIHDGHADVLSTNGADYIAPNAESLFKILSALGASFHPPRLESI